MPINHPIHNLFKSTKQSPVRDMTVGSPLKHIFLFSIPLLLGNAFQQMYSMVDTIIVGRLLGTNSLAAVGTTGPLNFLVLGFIFGLTSGFAVITAQKFGAKDFSGLKKSTAMNIKLNFLFALIFTVIAVSTSKPMLKLINTPDLILEEANTYISIIYWGIATTTLYNTAACLLRAIGDSRSPLYFLIISSLLNIVLDLLFILKFDMGVAGAAWATVISQAFSGIISVIYIIIRFPILHVKKSDFESDVWFAKQHLKIGFPMALQFSITAIGCIILQGALNIFGSVKIAAFTAAQKVEQLVTIPGPTYGVTMANYTGQNLGANNHERIKKGTTVGVLLSLAFSFFGLIIAMVFPIPLARLFIDMSETSSLECLISAKQYLWYTAPFYPPLFLIFIYRNVLQSMGKTFMPLMAGVFELLARFFAAYFLPSILGYIGVCLAGPIAWIAAAVPLAITYYLVIRKKF